MPPRRTGWIDWRNSEPRKILMGDLIAGILPLDENEMPARDAWELCYSLMAEFITAGVVYSQFEARLKDHRKQLNEDVIRAAQEADALDHDRLLFPRKDKKTDGKPVFDLHPAKLILRELVKHNNHAGKTPTEIRNMHDEFQAFDLAEFKRRIYQEIRRKKFLNYLNERRRQGHFI